MHENTPKFRLNFLIDCEFENFGEDQFISKKSFAISD